MQCQRRTIAACGTTFEVVANFKYVMEFPEEEGFPVVVVQWPSKLEWDAVRKVSGISSSHILRKKCLRELKLLRKFHGSNQIENLHAPDLLVQADGDFDELYLYRDLFLSGTEDRKSALARMGYLRDHIPKREEDVRRSWRIGAERHRSVVYDILRGLHYIHSAGVIHCDIRPGSILVDERLLAIISAFGLARKYKSDGHNNRNSSPAKKGYVVVDDETLWYRAPEFMLGFDNCGPAVDMWSVGCILAECLLGKPLFQGKDCLNMLHRIVDYLGKPPDSVFRSIRSARVRDYIHSLPDKPPVLLSRLFPDEDPLAIEILEQMLDLDPEKRISTEKALEHPYFSFFRNKKSEHKCRSLVDFSFEKEYKTEKLKRLIADEVNTFYKKLPWTVRDWDQKSWVNSFTDKVRGKAPSAESSTPRLSSRTILYPPYQEGDVGFGTAAGQKARFRLDNSSEELENALVDVKMYSEASEVQTFLSHLNACYDRIIKAEQRFIMYKHSLRQLVALCDIYANVHANDSATTPKTSSEMTAALDWFDALCHWLETKVTFDPISIVMNYVDVEAQLMSFFSQCPWPVREAYFESVNSTPQSLSPTFSEVLDGIRVLAANHELVERVALLSGDEAEVFADILDKALNIIDNSDRLRRKAFDLLRRICGLNHIIPRSFTLSPDATQLLSDRPEASGGFADIWRGLYSGRTVAFKVFRVYRLEEASGGQAELKDVFQEAVVWKRLQHPNITSLYGIDETTFPSQVALVSDWMPHGTVANYLNENIQANRLQLALGIASGLQYLHEMNVVHGDMKSANVLINEHRIACISDFGLAALNYSSKLVTLSVQAGSTRWMAPELLDPEHFGLERAELSAQSDIFALGMIIWELFTGRIPYYHLQKDAQVMSSILRNMRPLRPVQAVSFGLDDDIWELAEACWAENLRERPPMAVVLGRLKDALTRYGEAETSNEPQVWPLVLT
ncbi:hypothetical protein CERSUDRAFT_87399 [Gelatoporia subvermispora B]|uniref:Protein kinase domain-containing protein n=1 Tax=Ceriporiopsis subvermispora (strain B) TaxID=914234 RepID=M2R2E0_CERS8|nr:hypothetical protein CERSUDRAFT_87399 [Gelatoporia subvermispora B]